MSNEDAERTIDELIEYLEELKDDPGYLSYERKNDVTPHHVRGVPVGHTVDGRRFSGRIANHKYEIDFSVKTGSLRDE